MNRQIQAHNISVKQGCHIDASITQSSRKPKTRPTYEVVGDREERDDEADAQALMHIVEVTQPGADSEARWIKKGSQSLSGYKHTRWWMVSLVLAVMTTAVNCHDSRMLLSVLEKTGIQSSPGFMSTKRIAARIIAMLRNYSALRMTSRIKL